MMARLEDIDWDRLHYEGEMRFCQLAAELGRELSDEHGSSDDDDDDPSLSSKAA